MKRGKMHLVAYLKTGPASIFSSGWRHPESRLDDVFKLERYEYTARLLEDACFDAGFFADNLGLSDIYKGSFADFGGRGGQFSMLDPMVVLPVMARVTSRLGLGATLSTSFIPPYQIARSLASLDIVSGGRAAWNVVTSARNFEARNFGFDELADKDERYDRADDVLGACNALWDAWDPDAVVFDRKSGVFLDTSKIRYADYAGPFVRTRGPMSIPRSPQGRPVLLQAGASGRGRDFAARWAELVFSSQATKADSLAYTTDLKSRADKFGRSPDQCAVLPSISAVVGETESIAKEKAEFLESLVDPELVLAQNSNVSGADLSKVLSEQDISSTAGKQGVQGHRDRFAQTAREKGISFADAIRKPRALITGTPSMIADYMEDWFTSGACDGFVVPAAVHPATLEDFARFVVPELQRRGLFRKQYSGRTLRENIQDNG